jgi:GH43 family beta-xylosidase
VFHPSTPPTSPSSNPAAAEATFQNPLNFSGPDPWMTYYNGNYYLAATTWGGPFNGLTMRKAATIAALKKAAPVQIFRAPISNHCCNYWAPEFHLLKGPNGLRWYGYFSGGPQNCCNDQRMHVIESAGTDPMGPYTYKGQLKDTLGGWAIDTSVLQLNGSLYLLFSAFEGSDISAITNNQNIYIAPMSDPWTVAGKRVLLSSPTYGWERQDGNVNEGPVALQHNGKTFITYSASGCWGPNYKLGLLTFSGGNPLSTSAWIKSPEPVFQGTGQVYSPGHNTFFTSPDGKEDWIVYHANASATGGCDMQRTPHIQKFTWNSDGTPNFGSPLPLSTSLSAPGGEGSQK